MNHIYNIIFTVAMCQMNSNIKFSFLIVDEAFDACDDTSKKMVVKLVESVKCYYDWLFVISHDSVIKKYYNETLKIERIGDKCKRIYYV